MSAIYGVWSMKYKNRALTIPKNRNLFLFGARNTGKSTLLKHTFNNQNCFWVNLLNPDLEEKYSRNPNSLAQEILALEPEVEHIIIDEIQKIPKLLNIVHNLIESTPKIFILTGSSARKLKHGGANLLAGRAFVFNLFPFTFLELGEHFHLESALNWGTLPGLICTMETSIDKIRFLQAYAQTYLKEEIWLEQFIRKIDPFRKFLEVSAQCNGKILNIANIAKDVGVDDKTILQYFTILEDTLMGFMLEPYNSSFRKRLHAKPKFYYFDIGVCRALARMLSVPVIKSSSYYGEVFEHFIILEAYRLANYYFPEYRFSYLKTKDDVELDLIVERPGLPLLCIEIKSSSEVREEKLRSMNRLISDIPNAIGICICQEPIPKQIGAIEVLPWDNALKKYFTIC
jgi:predicted AAA+ superfamily ATPase